MQTTTADPIMQGAAIWNVLLAGEVTVDDRSQYRGR